VGLPDGEEIMTLTIAFSYELVITELQQMAGRRFMPSGSDLSSF